MPYGLNEELLTLQREVRKFVAKEIRPKAAEYDNSCEYPRKNV
ncbi:MAG: acyl-CoA dehydrogenase family protein, partial [bacterium]|nr:acyl-CoA dehydrogenase family protein [bacterium]